MSASLNLSLRMQDIALKRLLRSSPLAWAVSRPCLKTGTTLK